MKIPTLSILAALPLFLGACVNVEDANISATGGSGNYDNEAVAKGALAVDPISNLITAPVSKIIDPKTVVINRREEAMREVSFYGVSLPDKNKHPEVYATALGWLKEQVGDQFSVQIKTLPGAELKSYKIKGHLLLSAKQGGGYVSVTQAMLSQGLLIYDRHEEVPTKAEKLTFRKRQKEARDARRGVWKNVNQSDRS